MRNLIYKGPDISDQSILDILPYQLREILLTINGYVNLDGGFHLRGACIEPQWHSIRNVLYGEYALSSLFDTVSPSDIPFAQDCMGDQFILRNGIVNKLYAETGKIECMGIDIPGFFSRIEEDPVNFLQLHPLLQYRIDGGKLEPGQSLSVYPPFCFEESGNGVSLKAIDTLQLLFGHSRLAKAIGNSTPGFTIDMEEIF